MAGLPGRAGLAGVTQATKLSPVTVHDNGKFLACWAMNVLISSVTVPSINQWSKQSMYVGDE